MTTTKYRRFLWGFLEKCSIVAIYITAPFIMMEQLSSGKVISLLETLAITCVSGLTAIGGLESPSGLRPLISVSTHPLPARDFLRRFSSGYTEKDPHLGPA
jgi:hypothetical protein